jgi:hypothetical protein
MNARKSFGVGRVFTVALPILAIVVGCGSAQGISSSIDQGDPASVMKGALETMFSWQPGRDTSPFDAFARAKPLLSAPFAAQQPGLASPQTGSQWQQWANDRAVITAKAEIVTDEHPPDTADKVYRVVALKQSIGTPTMGVNDEINSTAWVTAVSTPDGWRVDSVQT